MTELDTLTEFCSVRQLEFLEAIKKHGSNKKAAEVLGVGRRVIDRSINRVKEKAALQGQSPAEGASCAYQTEVVKPSRIIVIPDVQAKPGCDFSYLRKIGRYIVEKQPETIVCIGDFADMPSLSSYDKGKKSFDGRRYMADIQASKDAMTALLGPIVEYNEKNKGKPYKPRMVLTLGNHEERINRAINDEPQLAGLLTVDALEYEKFGWEVIPFLEVVIINGIAFSHYFTSGLMGRPVSTAQACLTKKHMSAIQGHQQGLQIATGYRGDGGLLTSVIAGSCYEHDEAYMSSQGNKHWRGFLVLHDVQDGAFDLMPVSLSYINKRYS